MFEFITSPLDIIREYWKQKFEQALLLRQKLVINPGTDAYRLLHAEGDFLPGIIADVYAGTVVLQLLIKGTEMLTETWISILKELGFHNVYLKTKNSSQVIEHIDQSSRWLAGNGEMPLLVNENALKFEVNIEKGQKTGFFLDQRNSRELLRTLSAGKKVLNTFCYTGGFSAYAYAGGATEVHSVDISKDAIEACKANLRLNGYNDQHCYAEDCFDYLRHSQESYDIMVLDPPAFAKNARSVNNATRGYKELNLTAFKKIKPGGWVFTFSCSQNISRELFQKVVFGAAADARRNVRIVQHLTQPQDHPVNIFHPEGEYLKGLLLQVD